MKLLNKIVRFFVLNQQGIAKINWEKTSYVIVVMTAFFSGCLWLFDKVKGDPKFEETTIKPTIVVNRDSLALEYIFSQPHYFYTAAKGEWLSPDEIVDDINLSNGQIQLSISVMNGDCEGYQYILQNTVINDISYHTILPNKYISMEERYYGIMDPTPVDKPSKRVYGEDCGEEIDDLQAIGWWYNPKLNIKINNNSDENILIKKITCNVRKSRPNKFPLLYFTDGYGMQLPLRNDGILSAQNVIMQFDIQKDNDPIIYTGNYKYELSLPEVRPTAYDTIEYGPRDLAILDSFFIREGVDAHSIELFRNDSIYQTPTDKAGKFTDMKARIVGRVIYDGYLPNGNRHTDTVNFNYLQYLLQPEWGGTTFTYYNNKNYNIRLDSENDNYTRSYSTNESVSPKSGKNFYLTFSSAQPQLIVYLMLSSTITMTSMLKSVTFS